MEEVNWNSNPLWHLLVACNIAGNDRIVSSPWPRYVRMLSSPCHSMIMMVCVCVPFAECDQRVLSTGESNGTIITPNYPNRYPLNVLCHYYIDGLMDRQNLEKAKLNFEQFDIPTIKERSVKWYQFQQICIALFIRILLYGSICFFFRLLICQLAKLITYLASRVHPSIHPSVSIKSDHGGQWRYIRPMDTLS